MSKTNIALLDTKKQVTTVVKILRRNHLFIRLLERLKKLGLPDWYVGGGSIPQIIWNYLHNFDENFGINDFDAVYFDSKDLSYEAEDTFIKKGEVVFKDFPIKVEIRNEARVHLWYPQKFGRKIKPFKSVEEAISTFPTTSSAIGVSSSTRGLKVFAPRGLFDMLSMIIRPNKVHVSKSVYEQKTYDWKKKWPKLKIIPWECS